MIKGSKKPQVPTEIFVQSMAAMKAILRAEEWKHEGRDNDGYKYWKALIMDQIYPMLQGIFKNLEELKLVEKCECGNSVQKRGGYTECGWCHGCGYKNSEHLNDLLFDIFEKVELEKFKGK